MRCASHRSDRALVWAGAEALWFGRTDLPRAVVDVIDCNPLEFWRGFLSYRDLRQRYRALREIGVATRYARRTVRSYRRDRLRRRGGCTLAAPDRRTRHGARRAERRGRSALDSIAPEADEPTLSFTGALDYQPNIEAVMFAVERDLATHPCNSAAGALRHCRAQSDAEVSALAGHSQHRDRARRARHGARKSARSWVSIAPMRSGVGIKNKVLEAWACARPVVLSRLATNGLIVPADHAALVSANADAMAAMPWLRCSTTPTSGTVSGHSARDNVQRTSPGPAPRRASMRCCADEITAATRCASDRRWHRRRSAARAPKRTSMRPQDRAEIIRRVIDIAALHRRADERSAGSACRAPTCRAAAAPRGPSAPPFSS